MSYSLTWLAKVLRDAGLTVKEVQGWQSRGRGPMGSVVGVICHHTAGAKTGEMPSLGVIVNGRPDLPGPLSQLALGRSGTFYVVAAGRCNHAGPGTWQGYTTGNSQFIGIEAENTGKPSDPWPAAQMDAYARGVAAILKHIKAKPIMCAGHKEYARPIGRKPDPTFDMGAFRSRVAALMDTKPITPPKPVVAKELFEQKSPKIVGDLMKDFDLTDVQASGIVGNLGHETGGFRLMQEQKPTSGIGGYGWAQWTGVRRTAFIQWCKMNGLSPDSDGGNYGYLKHELTDTSERTVIPAVRDTSTLNAAMRVFEVNFERAGVKHYDSRLAYAQRALAAYRASGKKAEGSAVTAVIGAAAATAAIATTQSGSSIWTVIVIVLISAALAAAVWYGVKWWKAHRAASQAAIEADVIEVPDPPSDDKFAATAQAPE